MGMNNANTEATYSEILAAERAADEADYRIERAERERASRAAFRASALKRFPQCVDAINRWPT